MLKIDKKQTKFVSVLVDPNDQTLEKIKDLNFDYYQIYDVSPKRAKEIKERYKIKIISALTIGKQEDVDKYKDYMYFQTSFFLTLKVIINLRVLTINYWLIFQIL